MGFRDYSTANSKIVDKNGHGDFTTIATALTAASSLGGTGTIFIRTGTYTEDLSLVAGWNLTAFGSDSSLNGTGKVIISGTCTMTTAGSVTISGIQLQTNSAALLAVTGSAASVVMLNNCYLNCTNNTGISFTTSSASGIVYIKDCICDLGTTGIGLWSSTSSGIIKVYWSFCTNSGASTTVSSASAGTTDIKGSFLAIPLGTTSTGALTIQHSNIATNLQNATAITHNGTGAGSGIQMSYILSGSASAITIGVGATLALETTTVNSTNTNAVTGSGTVNYQAVALEGSSQLINTTTQTGGLLKGGVNQAPSAGFIGEQIRSAVTAVSVSNATPTNITSISITAGVWDVSGVFIGNNSGTAITAVKLGIGTNTGSFTGTTSGDSQLISAEGVGVWASLTLTIPSFRIVLTATTTYYLVGQINFASGTGTMDGRISATRVG